MLTTSSIYISQPYRSIYQLHLQVTSHKVVYLLQLAHQSLESSPSLFAGGQDLIGGQDESVAAGISQLRSECSLSARNVGDPVQAVAVGRVNGLADRAGGVLGAVHGGEGVRKGRSEFLEDVVVLGEGVAGVAVCYIEGNVWLANLDWFLGSGFGGLTRQHELRVGVHVHEDLEAVAVRKVLDEFGVDLGLGGIAFRGSTECFFAGIRRRARSFPLVGPVAVEIHAYAFAAVVGLTVLTPHAVALLGENEAYLS